MTPREIIAKAWAITTKEARIRRWAFAAALLETILAVQLVTWQASYLYGYLQNSGEAGIWGILLNVLLENPRWGAVIIGILVTLSILGFFIPHVCRGAIIGLGAKAYRGDEVSGGLVLGIYNFLPLFLIHEILTLSSTTTFITATSLIIRYIEEPIRTLSIAMLSGLFLFSLLLKFFFSFAEEAVVIQKLGIFHAIGRSFKLIVSHLGHIVFLLLLLLVISIRIFLNATIVILVPGLIIGLGLLLALVLPPMISYSVAGIVGIFLIIAASYFFAYLQAFHQTVWTITFLEFIRHRDLDVILEGETI